MSTAVATPRAEVRIRRREWSSLLWRAVRTRRGAVGMAITVAILLIAFLGPMFAPHGSSEFVTTSFAPPSSAAPIGGDRLGRDVLSRVLDGGWQLILIAAAATIFGVALGAVAGITAGYSRNWRDGAIMRVVDVFLAFPQLVFALVLVSIIGPKVWLIIVAVGISHAPQVARVLRAATLDISERNFVHAAELRGVPARVIMAREITPNLVSTLMVEVGLRFTLSVVLIAGLSFIGFGLQPPAPNWGYMINENRIGLTSNPWAVAVPAILIALLAVGVNTFTDSLARVALGGERTDPLVLNESPAGATGLED